jgi:hypothetical protein
MALTMHQWDRKTTKEFGTMCLRFLNEQNGTYFNNRNLFLGTFPDYQKSKN